MFDFNGFMGPGYGAGGMTGLLGGPAAYGDSAMTGMVNPNGSGLAPMMTGDLGNSLGTAPTGLFGGLNPGGGMTQSLGGAMGGGLSGQVAGQAPIGGAQMGGLMGSNYTGLNNLSPQQMAMLGQMGQRQTQQAQQQPEMARPFGFGNPAMHTTVAQSGMLPYMRMGG
jgi:hypothetical protein